MTDFMFLSKLQIHHFPLSLHMLRAMHTVLISLSLSPPQVHFWYICHSCRLWKCWDNLFWFWDGEERGALLALLSGRQCIKVVL